MFGQKKWGISPIPTLFFMLCALLFRRIKKLRFFIPHATTPS
jgi:hypothetical protein